jgi:hypothetical protein
MSLLCGGIAGRALLAILCLDRCSCFYEHATYFSMPLLRSEVEGRALLDIPENATGVFVLFLISKGRHDLF